MVKKSAVFTILAAVLIVLCSCTLLVKPLDKNMNFSEQLLQLESAIRSEKWEQADKNLEAAEKAWKRLKPWLQIDIDHDYVHEIEENLAKLKAYIDTEEQPDALANILLIQETWEDMESL
ncbi:MAG: hypothetical protein APF77_20790 [Clostridia bacterium BRH_c25]|nr:MAG: hypothetical protein APF77_20790 [Clostridia bacterium BRH_c25]